MAHITTREEIELYKQSVETQKSQLASKSFLTELEKFNLDTIYDYQIEMCSQKLQVLAIYATEIPL